MAGKEWSGIKRPPRLNARQHGGRSLGGSLAAGTLRKAVGATKNQILTQFLIETVTLSLLGGIIGIAFGIGLAALVTLSGALTAVITFDSILLAFTFALAIGVFFGLYPAYRAANLHPMVALRYE